MKHLYNKVYLLPNCFGIEKLYVVLYVKSKILLKINP